MATATACTPAGAAVASQAARGHSASRPVASASFMNSELFSSKAGLSARAVGASLPVHSRRASVLTVCKILKGDIVPPVGLKDQDGKLVTLDKFRGKPLVLYFYPADETPGCTKQAFKARYRLPFNLLSDEGNKLRKDWGVPSDLFGALTAM